MEKAMDSVKDAPTTEETAEMVELEQIVRAKDGKTEDVPSARREDDPDAG